MTVAEALAFDSRLDTLLSQGVVSDSVPADQLGDLRFVAEVLRWRSSSPAPEVPPWVTGTALSEGRGTDAPTREVVRPRLSAAIPMVPSLGTLPSVRRWAQGRATADGAGREADAWRRSSLAMQVALAAAALIVVALLVVGQAALDWNGSPAPIGGPGSPAPGTHDAHDTRLGHPITALPGGPSAMEATGVPPDADSGFPGRPVRTLVNRAATAATASSTPGPMPAIAPSSPSALPTAPGAQAPAERTEPRREPTLAGPSTVPAASASPVQPATTGATSVPPTGAPTSARTPTPEPDPPSATPPPTGGVSEPTRRPSSTPFPEPPSETPPPPVTATPAARPSPTAGGASKRTQATQPFAASWRTP